MHTAIVGAGMAGLTVANALCAAGHKVRVFDKGRGPGGRMSTRRVMFDDLTLKFDHGAQYISPRTPEFHKQVDRWVEAGVAGHWLGRAVAIDEARHVTVQNDKSRFVGTPSMNDIIRHLAADLEVEWGRHVQTIKTSDSLVLEFDDGGTETGFDLVVVAVPAEQVSDIVGGLTPDFAATAAAVQSSPCWTVMAAFDTGTEIEWDAVSIANSAIGWAARNSSKPGRPESETWVLQATPKWSVAHLEDDREQVVVALLAAFSEFGNLPPTLYATAHRWRYSQANPQASELFHFDSKLGIGVCGDWCRGPNVEDAWHSGIALSDRILKGDK